MLTVLLVLGTILAFCCFPAATILAFLGLWIGGTVGAAIGGIIGFCIQAAGD